MINTVLHNVLEDGELHNPKGLQYAEDVLSFDSHTWHNSGLIWNETLGKWKAKPSGSTGVGGGIDNIVEDTTPQLGGNLDGNTFGINSATFLSGQKISGGTIRANKLVMGFNTASSQLYVQSGATFGRRTLWGTGTGFVNVKLTPDDGLGYIQGLKVHVDKDNLSALYGQNATAIGDNDKNVGLYVYAAEADVNLGLQVAAGDVQLSRTSNLAFDATPSSNYKLFIASGSIKTTRGAISTQCISSSTYIGGLHYPYNYYIYKDGDIFKSIIGSNGRLFNSNTTASNVIQQTINQLEDTGGIIRLAEGAYNISSTIKISGNNLTIEGVGNGTILYPKNNLDTQIFKNESTFPIIGLTIRDLAISGRRLFQTPENEDNVAIMLESTENTTFSNLYIHNMSKEAISFTSSGPHKNIIINNCIFKNNYVSGSIGGSVTTTAHLWISYAQNIIVDNCLFGYCTDNAIGTYYVNNCTLSNSHISGCYGNSLDDYTVGFSFENCTFTGEDCRIVRVNNPYCKLLSVNNCRMYDVASPNSTTTAIELLYSISSVSITNNDLNGGAILKYGVKIQSGQCVTVANNRFTNFIPDTAVVYASRVKYCNIENNQFFNPDSTGTTNAAAIQIYGSATQSASFVNVVGNTIIDNLNPHLMYEGIRCTDASRANNVIITNNIISGATNKNIDADSKIANLIIRDNIGWTDIAWRHVSSQAISANRITSKDTNWVDLTDGGATTLHTHTGLASAPGGTMTDDIGGAGYAYGISSLKYISSQRISSGTIIGDVNYHANYLITKNGNTTYCRKGDTGKILNYDTNSYKPIQYGLDRVYENGGGTLLVNPGVYFISSSLVISGSTNQHATSFIGCGRTSTILCVAPNITTQMPSGLIKVGRNKFGGLSVISPRHFHIGDMRLSGNNKNTTGIYVNVASRSDITDMDIEYFEHFGIWIKYNHTFNILNCNVRNNGDADQLSTEYPWIRRSVGGIKLGDSEYTNSGANLVNIKDCNLEYNFDGIWFNAGDGLTVQGCNIEGIKRNAIFCGKISGNRNVSLIDITDNWFEANNSGGYNETGDILFSGLSATSVNLQGNYFVNTSDSHSTYIIRFGYGSDTCYDVVINHNRLTSSYSKNLYMQQVQNCSIVNNAFASSMILTDVRGLSPINIAQWRAYPIRLFKGLEQSTSYGEGITVYVPASDYSEYRWNVYGSFTVPDDGLTIIGDGPMSRLMFSSTSDYITCNSKDRFTLRNLTIGTSPYGDVHTNKHAVVVKNSERVRIENVNFEGISGTAVILSGNTHTGRIAGCNFSGSTDYGLSIDAGIHDFEIINNIFQDNLDGDIYNRNTDSTTIFKDNIGISDVGEFHYPSDFIIYKQDSTYYYKNCRNGQTYSHSDASAIFNNLLSGSRNRISIYVASGIYTLKRTINCSGSSKLGFTLSKGVILDGEMTGLPIFDFTNAGYIYFNGGVIRGDMDNAKSPSVGFLLARKSAGYSAGFHVFEEVSFTNKFSSACVYNLASEENLYLHCNFSNYFSANRRASCVKVFGTNMDNITSPYSYPQSGSTGHINFESCSFRHYGRNKPSGGCVWIGSKLGSTVSDTRFHGCYFGAADTLAAIILSGSVYIDGPIDFNGCRVEGDAKYCIYGCLSPDDANRFIYGLTLRDFHDNESTDYAIYVSSAKLSRFHMEGDNRFDDADGMDVWSEIQFSDIQADDNASQINKIRCTNLYATSILTSDYSNIQVNSNNKGNTIQVLTTVANKSDTHTDGGLFNDFVSSQTVSSNKIITNSLSSQSATIGSYTNDGTYLNLIAGQNKNTTLKFRESTDNYGFTLKYDGASTNDLQLFRHENSATGTLVASIDRTIGQFDIDTTINCDAISSQAISGQWRTPLYTSLTAAGAASTRPGQIIRTSGNANGTWVWMSIYGGSSYQWMQLTYLTGV